ncbi:MAG: YIP1 family protein, partial [Candidatus Acidiferrales bacterium]
MATVTAAVPETPQHIGAFGRLIGAIINPRPTFEDIARKPSWLLPLLLLIILSLSITYIFGKRVGWRAFMEKQLAQNSRVQQLTPEQREQTLETQVKVAPIIGYVFGVIGFPIVVVVIAAIFMGIFNATSSAALDFKTSLGVITHSYAPFVIASLLGVLI